MARQQDRFANVAGVRMAGAANGALEYTQLLTGVSLGQGLGILIDRIEYDISSAENILDTDADYLMQGLSTSNGQSYTDLITNGQWNDRRIIHHTQLRRGNIGTPATGLFTRYPVAFDFRVPMIVASPYIYAFNANVGGNAALINFVKMYFRYLELTSQEYLEVAEAFILQS
jgi:hypothetical protein